MEDNIIYSNISTKPAAANTANYKRCATWDAWFWNPTLHSHGNPDLWTTVGTNGGPSAYGTFDQSGNVYEWNDLDSTVSHDINNNPTRGLRGGSYQDGVFDPLILSTEYHAHGSPAAAEVTSGLGWSVNGFRIASLLNPFSLSNFVFVDDAGNSADTGGSFIYDGIEQGRVAYNYYINKYCVTNTEYALFLNNVAITDSYDLYAAASARRSLSAWGVPFAYNGIDRSGASGSYSYSVKTNYGNKPVVFVNWFHCARYCNWLHNGQGAGSTETGAYTLNGAVTGDAIVKNVGAKYHIPTENEWYKAAYYKGGGTNAGYWLYATQSDSAPTCVTANSVGDGVIA